MASETSLPVIREETLANGGVIKKVLREGEGAETPPNGAEVFVHYVGTLMDGTPFDSSREREEPFSFKLGQHQVISGWDKGVATMKKGELALLICNPEHAYGASGSPPKIPPNATLQFEVELLSWTNKQKVAEDGGVMKQVLQQGSGYNRPNDNAVVTLKFVGRVAGGHEFDTAHKDTEVTYNLGEEYDLIPGFTAAVRNMLLGERSIFFIKPSYGYGASGNAALGIPPDAHLEYDIELVSFEKGKETWEMTDDEKIDYAMRCKEQGNAYFTRGRLTEAFAKYEKGTSVFQHDVALKDLSQEQRQRLQQVKAICHNNMATCKLKAQDWKAAASFASKVLEWDGNNVKALYRRASALAHMEEFERANEDLTRAHSMEPQNKDVLKLHQAVKARIAKQKQKERKLFGDFFKRVKLTDDDKPKVVGITVAEFLREARETAKNLIEEEKGKEGLESASAGWPGEAWLEAFLTPSEETIKRLGTWRRSWDTWLEEFADQEESRPRQAIFDYLWEKIGEEEQLFEDMATEIADLKKQLEEKREKLRTVDEEKHKEEHIKLTQEMYDLNREIDCRQSIEGQTRAMRYLLDRMS